ncbi:MAG TPA: EAL domain-containing protein, partial [Acidobacteriaceae bacterium]|nr:EAL domain-containing protein [Acidobacteriaceae bacterium]
EPQNGIRVLELEIMLPGGLVQAYLQHFEALDLRGLEDAEVSLAGVAGADFNAKWQLMHSVLYATEAEDLQVLRRPALEVTRLPLTRVDDVAQTREVVDRSRRLRVRGSVTYYRPAHAVVIEQDGHSLFAATRETRPIPNGSVVDVVGFAEDGGYGPALGQSKIIPTGLNRPVQPATVSYAQAVNGTYSDDLVTIRGRILSQVHTDAADTLSLAVDEHPVTVTLERSSDIRALPQMPAGTLVAVTGICRITTSSSWGDPGVTPMLFRIDMRSPEDLTIVHLPSWWTVSHLLFALAGLLPLSVAVMLWAIALRRRVTLQNSRIASAVRLEKERSRLLEAISSDAPLEVLLRDICSLVEKYGDGLRCSCLVGANAGNGEIQHSSITVGDLPTPVRLRKTLSDREGSPIGLFSVGGQLDQQQSELTGEQQEVVAIGSSLVSLAVGQRRLYHELNYTSSHDGLTGLPNRRSVDACLQTLLEQAEHSGQCLGVAYIDVNHFKRVNDAYGHKSGDLYLQQIARRLAAEVRETDLLARIGGDEFLLVANPISRIEHLEETRCRLAACFARSFLLEDVRISGSASIGIACYPDHGSTAEELRRRADADMYAMKQSGREMPDCPRLNGVREVFTRADLEAAFAAGQFLLFYQPQFSARGKLRGVEALLRLTDPNLGTISPDAFIHVAERSGFIVPLGAWVLREALADAKLLGLDGFADMRMIVNVASQQMERAGFADEVLHELETAGLPPSVLELEITERSAAGDQGRARRELQQLHDAGVHIAIDDFGVEHSCLGMLHSFPIDTLKIDRSFVRAISTEPLVLPVIGAVLSMANALGKRVVAEGVETQADVDALLGMGEMDLQGYFLGRPQPVDQISLQMEAWRSGISFGRLEGSVVSEEESAGESLCEGSPGLPV